MLEERGQEDGQGEGSGYGWAADLVPEHYELRHARWGPGFAERSAYVGCEGLEGGRKRRGGCLRDATTVRPASWASRNSSPPVMEAQTEGKQRQERRREARKERRTSMPGIVLDGQRGRQAGGGGGGEHRKTLAAGLLGDPGRGDRGCRLPPLPSSTRSPTRLVSPPAPAIGHGGPRSTSLRRTSGPFRLLPLLPSQSPLFPLGPPSEPRTRHFPNERGHPQLTPLWRRPQTLLVYTSIVQAYSLQHD